MNPSTQSIVVIILGLLVPILTAYFTQFVVNLMKKIDSFAASRPLVKQLVAFVIAAVTTIVIGIFHTSDIGAILNILIAGGLAQVFHNGNSTAMLKAATNTSVTGTAAAPIAIRLPSKPPESVPRT